MTSNTINVYANAIGMVAVSPLDAKPTGVPNPTVRRAASTMDTVSPPRIAEAYPGGPARTAPISGANRPDRPA
ncbi:hypothetical protein GCM10023170_014900 [Phytohabitans houttuyneae]|uniref:Uncharacterized protein n=1 Tax=Phytohabitans houttuyneae TaxID=1076126 RepID=A0A6V8KRN9_9ACTN|nr:hypothetical protein Phou_102700 [Phytohabitans houttuyneae]